MISAAFEAAAAAGKLAGSFCAALVDALETFAAEPIPQPSDDFDEDAAAEYLRGNCGLGAVPEPPLTDVEIIATRQLIEERFGLTASTDGDASVVPRPPVEDASRITGHSLGDTGGPQHHPF